MRAWHRWRHRQAATVTLPPGVFELSEPIRIKGNVHLVGSGESETVLQVNGECGIFISGGKHSGVEHLTIRGPIKPDPN